VHNHKWFDTMFRSVSMLHTINSLQVVSKPSYNHKTIVKSYKFTIMFVYVFEKHNITSSVSTPHTRSRLVCSTQLCTHMHMHAWLLLNKSLMCTCVCLSVHIYAWIHYPLQHLMYLATQIDHIRNAIITPISDFCLLIDYLNSVHWQ